MTTDLTQAKDLLKTGAYTCVLCHDTDLCTSALRGVKPLVVWYHAGREFSRYAAADKVVGRATAFLYLLLGVRELYAAVISRSAYDLLTDNGVEVYADKQVPHIINRAGDGICPFEEAVLHIDDPATAYTAILRKMEELQISLS